MKEHRYKGYIVKRNGTRELPWNIYIEDDESVYGDRVGSGYTFIDCKVQIDDGCYEDERNVYFTNRDKMKKWRNKFGINKIEEDINVVEDVYVIEVNFPWDSNGIVEEDERSNRQRKRDRFDAFVLNSIMALDARGYVVFESHSSNIKNSLSYYICAFKGEDFENSDLKIILHIRLSNHRLSDDSFARAKQYFNKLSQEYKMPIDKDRQEYLFLNIVAHNSTTSGFYKALKELKSTLDDIEEDYYTKETNNNEV